MIIFIITLWAYTAVIVCLLIINNRNYYKHKSLEIEKEYWRNKYKKLLESEIDKCNNTIKDKK